MIFPRHDASPYTGRPNSDPNVRWTPEMVDGNVLFGSPAWGGWACGSLTWWQEKYIFLFGRYDVTLRSWPHDLLSFHALLWPQSENWPPEIDIAESFHSDRKTTHAWLHGLTGGHSKQGFSIQHDITQETTFSVIWEPERIRFLCDDVPFGDTSQDSPQEPCRFAIQVETHATDRGFTPDKSIGRTNEFGPPQRHLTVPVVELIEVKYSPLEN